MHTFIYTGKLNSFEHARSFARGLNCIEGKNVSAYNVSSCGKCMSCITFESNNNPDVFYVTPTKTKTIGVDDVRAQIITPMSSKPFKYKYKIFITENAELLTPQAQNALLKTIEEPMPYGIFLFAVKDTYSFLPTVLSRAAIVKTDEAGEPDAKVKSLAADILNKVSKANVYNALLLHKMFEPLEKEELGELLDLLYIEAGKELWKSFEGNSHRWIKAAEAVKHAKKLLSSNGNKQLTIELMLLEMRANV